MVREVFVQLLGVSVSFTPVVAGSSIPHNFTLDATSGEPPAVSLDSGVIV